MGNKIKNIASYLWKNKIIWSVILFIVIIGFVDSSSFLNRLEKQRENKQLRAEIQKYEEQCRRDSAKLKQLMASPEAIVKVARETHLMKAEDEDVYIVTVKQ